MTNNNDAPDRIWAGFRGAEMSTSANDRTTEYLRANGETVRGLVEALEGYLDLTSDEKGWGTYPRMEGADIYTEEEAVRGKARAALAAFKEGK